ncbi:GNAT family N-acetyltransferase [Lysobacter cavernae]|uniref:GNAT family N-acetyltransferase n=1 Tax=Lysobacter cavernae TaxID=1685901 RepID=A0ABV7RNP4_9GAMM
MPAQPARAPPALVTIETNGFLLRTLVPADVTPRFVEWINDARMREGLNLPELGFTAERLAQFIAGFDGVHHHFIGIFDRANGLLLGFYTLDVSLAHKVGNITASIGEPEYAGQRVFWRTIDALLDHFFTFRNIDKITARILAKNHGMLFNFVGNTRFVCEARLRKECLTPAGERVDVLVFASFKDGKREDGTAP